MILCKLLGHRWRWRHSGERYRPPWRVIGRPRMELYCDRCGVEILGFGDSMVKRPELKELAEKLAKERSSVTVTNHDPHYEEWKEIIQCLCGGLDYLGLVRWLSYHDSIESALEDARRYRDLA